MSPAKRCDEIMRLLDEALGERDDAEAAGPVHARRAPRDGRERSSGGSRFATRSGTPSRVSTSRSSPRRLDMGAPSGEERSWPGVC
jgi:hypothetical protein